MPSSFTIQIQSNQRRWGRYKYMNQMKEYTTEGKMNANERMNERQVRRKSNGIKLFIS